MSKAAMCLRMLEILSTGKVYKIDFLASILDTEKRNISEYRKVLESIGYQIDTLSGKYGGYQLNDRNRLPVIKLTEEEKKALFDAYDYLLTRKEFVNKKDLIDAMAKIASTIHQPEQNDPLLALNVSALSMSEEEIQTRYHFIENAIKKRKVIDIQYSSLKHGMMHHILHPYRQFLKNGEWFFLAYNPEVKDVWTFKLNRLSTYAMTEEKYVIPRTFKFTDYVDEKGFKNNGEVYEVVYLVSGVKRRLIEERPVGVDQTIIPEEGDWVRVASKMTNKDQIISFFLGAGTEAKVIAPEWLKNEVKEAAQKIVDTYKEE